MTIPEALALFQENILKKLYHQDYDHVKAYKRLLKQLITGKDSEELLKRFSPTEDEATFEAKAEIYVSITKPITYGLKTPFYRVGRLDNVREVIAYTGSNDEKRVQELNDFVTNYSGAKSVRQFLSSKFTNLIFRDPNAFLVTDFDPFDPDVEKARPYPYIIPSENAVNFRFKNEVLQWLIEHNEIQYFDKQDRAYKGSRYRMYLKNEILEYTQIHPDNAVRTFGGYMSPGRRPVVDIAASKDLPDTLWYTEDKRYFTLKVYRPNGGEVQAFRIGYMPDEETEERTVVSPIDPAIPYLLKSIRTVSELDLAVNLHVHAQKIQREMDCPGMKDPVDGTLTSCIKGRTLSGDTCSTCKGLGHIPITTSSAEWLSAPPRKDPQDPIFPLSEVAMYLRNPVEGLTFLKDYTEALGNACWDSMYNQDKTQKQRVNMTATEVVENKDGMYNTLEPYADHISRAWKKIVRDIATFTDLSAGLELTHSFPSDFKLMSMGEMYMELQMAKNANADDFDLQEINDSIAKKRFADDPVGYKRTRVKRRFMPFLGKSADEIKFILSTGRARKEDEILYTHSDTIVDDLEAEIGPEFFDFPYSRQSELIMARVKLIQNELSAQSTFQVSIPIPIGA